MDDSAAYGQLEQKIKELEKEVAALNQAETDMPISTETGGCPLLYLAV